MIKKILSLFIALTAVAWCFVGCSKPEPDSGPDSDVTSNVAFKEQEIVIYQGKTAQLEVLNLSENETVTSFESNNAEVASVSESGLVTANKAGTATVKVVTSLQGQALARIEVLSSDFVYLPSIVFDFTSLVLQKGDDYALGYTVLYKGNAVNAVVSFDSDDQTVATVDGKTLTAKGVGSCTVTASCEYDNQKTVATFTVTVTEKSVAVVTNYDNREIWTKDKFLLEVYVTENGSPAEVADLTFASGNASVATVDENNYLTAKIGGTAKITAKFSLNGVKYVVERDIYVYGARTLKINANGEEDQTIRGLKKGDKVILSLKNPPSNRAIKCWYVNGEKIPGNTFVMPDSQVVAEAKLVNQTEGDFTANFATGTIYDNRLSYAYLKGELKDSQGETAVDNDYVSLNSATKNEACIVYNFDESVEVTDSASVVIRFKLASGAKLYLGYKGNVRCMFASSTSSAPVGVNYKVKVNTDVWTELSVPLQTFADIGNFASAVEIGVVGIVYVDYITVNY